MKKNPVRKSKYFKKVCFSVIIFIASCSNIFCQNIELNTDICEEPAVEIGYVREQLSNEPIFRDSLHTLDTYVEQKIKAFIKKKHPDIENTHWFVSFTINYDGKVINVNVMTDNQYYADLNQFVTNVFLNMPNWTPCVVIINGEKINRRRRCAYIIKF
jgi:hypothetical protein